MVVTLKSASIVVIIITNICIIYAKPIEKINEVQRDNDKELKTNEIDDKTGRTNKGYNYLNTAHDNNKDVEVFKPVDKVEKGNFELAYDKALESDVPLSRAGPPKNDLIRDRSIEDSSNQLRQPLGGYGVGFQYGGPGAGHGFNYNWFG